jgi:hypothetical protein
VIIFVTKFLKMKMTGNQMIKRLTLLLIAVFSWLFIGSLIIFHQEHVLGKHTSAFEHLFVVPKTKDETVIGLKHVKTQQGHYSIPADFIIRPATASEHIAGLPETLVFGDDLIIPDSSPGLNLGLRAPPAA